MTSLPGLLSNPADFITKDIFQLLGLGGVSQQQKDDLLEVMLYTVTNRVMARILDQLSEDEQHQLEGFLDREDTAGMVAFLQQHDIDYAELFSQEALVYKAEVVNLVSNPDSAKAFMEE